MEEQHRPKFCSTLRCAKVYSSPRAACSDVRIFVCRDSCCCRRQPVPLGRDQKPSHFVSCDRSLHAVTQNHDKKVEPNASLRRNPSRCARSYCLCFSAVPSYLLLRLYLPLAHLFSHNCSFLRPWKLVPRAILADPDEGGGGASCSKDASLSPTTRSALSQPFWLPSSISIEIVTRLSFWCMALIYSSVSPCICSSNASLFKPGVRHF